MSGKNVLIRVEHLSKHFPVRGKSLIRRVKEWVHAVDDVTFEIQKGETLGLVGESGCGKSTLGWTILQLYRPTTGSVYFRETDLTALTGEEMRGMRRSMQIVFQDPYSSLDPRLTVGNVIVEPLAAHGVGTARERRERVQYLSDLVGIGPDSLKRYPHEFSGGQRQRIALARALALQPDFIVCDEPLSALDVSIQAQVVNLFEDLKQRFALTYLFISHDLSMVRHISDRMAVMYVGEFVEYATRDELCKQALHPYTQALMSAVPIADPVKESKRHGIPLEGDVASPRNPPPGCRFHTRCPHAIEVCKTTVPDLHLVSPNHWVACRLV